MDWTDFVLGIGFAFVLEGLVWSLFPRQIINVVQQLAELNLQNLRYLGVGSLALGVAIIWFVYSSRIAGG